MSRAGGVRPDGIALAVAMVTLSPRSSGQELLWKVYGDPSHLGLGGVVEKLGDVSGDGIPDIVASGGGYVRVLSGADGSTVYTIQAANFGDGFGSSIAFLGDIDGDGASDFAVGAPLVTRTVFHQGEVTVHSGQTGSLIYFVDGASTDLFGWALATLGDLDGDGISDFVAGSGANYALVLSGADGSPIWTLTSPSTPIRFGEVVGGGGDVDGDGIPDAIVGDIYSSFGVNSGGAASVFSGATGLLLYEFGSTRKNAYFGAAVTIPGDIDRDGYDDLLIGAPRDDRTPTGIGYAVVYSGKDGSILLSFVPSDGNGYTHYSLDWALGASLRGVGDTNDDGFVDLMIGAPSYADGVGMGTALIYSCRDGSLLYHIQDLSNFASSGFASALVPAGDLDSDGLTDFIVTQPTEDDGSNVNVGGVTAWKGHDFYVDARARVATAGVNVTVTPGQGIAGNPYALFLLGVNGTPTFTLLSVGVLDAAGRRVIDAQVPFNVGANTLELQAFTLDANGKLLPSGVETFLTQ